LDNNLLKQDKMNKNKTTPTKLGHYRLDFQEFSVLCNGILKRIEAAGIQYRGILCPLRGGFYLSNFMSRRLGLPLYYIQISSRNGRDQGDFTVGLQHELDEGRFLLCDDIFDSGKTVETIHRLYPHAHFDTACLLSRVKDADIIYGKFVDNITWVDFFWEVM